MSLISYLVLQTITFTYTADDKMLVIPIHSTKLAVQATIHFSEKVGYLDNLWFPFIYLLLFFLLLLKEKSPSNVA